MSKAFERIKRGLKQAVAHQEGKARGVRLYTPSPVDIQALKAGVGSALLVRTGKYREDLVSESGIEPTATVDSIADVPELLGVP